MASTPTTSAAPASEHVGAVALAAGEVDDALALDPLGDPLVDGEVAAEPVVLLGDVGQGPLPGQLERRHALGLVRLHVALIHGRADGTVPRMPAAADATAERIRDVNTRYHDLAAGSYDAKWGIDFGETGREQVGGKLRKALGERPGHWEHALEIGAGTGYFSLNLMLDGHDRAADRDRHRPRHARRARGQRRAARSSTSRRSRPTPSSCPSRTRPSTSCSATPSSTTSPT